MKFFKDNWAEILFAVLVLIMFIGILFFAISTLSNPCESGVSREAYDYSQCPKKATQ